MSRSRVALVTGGKRGIGRAIVDRLADDGIRAVCRDLPELDIGKAQSCRTAVADVLHDHGQLDLLVNNAGVNHPGTVVETSEADWVRILDVNLNGTFRMCVAAFEALRQSEGAVVNLASTAGQIAIEGTAAYSVSKAGILHLTRVLAVEWAPFNIRVNAVAPTIVPTDMTAAVRADPDYMSRKLASIPLGRMATVDEVAGAVAYLFSENARMITGHTLFIDGGATIL